jgi:hypothetical protein
VTAADDGLLRPVFFAGMLLTEDDMTALTGYVTAKARLRNRMLFGSGVVCGLDVVCTPCDGSTIAVRSGYALDCCGHDVVVPSGAKLDVAGLLRDMRTRCDDPCDDEEPRDYGLYLRYLEERVEPVAAYPTDDSCGGECQPSRVRESYGFLLKTIEETKHGDDPGGRLAHCLGDAGKFAEIRARAYRLDRYRDVLALVGADPAQAVTFDDAYVEMFVKARQDLETAFKETGGDPDGDATRAITEQVRLLAALIARYDLADHKVDQVQAALPATRKLLVTVAAVLEPRLKFWADPVLRSTAAATLAEAVAQCGPDAHPLEPERRMLVAGLPLSPALRTELFADLSRLRQWLQVRLESMPDRADCTLPTDIGLPLPVSHAEDGPADAFDMQALAKAAARLTGCLWRLLADCACRSLQRPCHDCADTDVLLARITVLGCTVQQICTIERPRVDPSVPPVPPGAWALATRVCCAQPDRPPVKDLSNAAGMLAAPVYDTDLDRLLALLSEGPAR